MKYDERFWPEPGVTTEPVRVLLDVEEVFMDLGLMDLYDEAFSSLENEYANACDQIYDTFVTEEEHNRLSATHTLAHSMGDPDWDEVLDSALYEELATMWDRVQSRANVAEHPAAQLLAEVNRAHKELAGLLESDQQQYFEAYQMAAKRSWAERVAPRELDIRRSGSVQLDWGTDQRDFFLAQDIHESTVLITPLPMTGRPPSLADGKPAVVVRNVGLDYLTRLRLSPRASQPPKPQLIETNRSRELLPTISARPGRQVRKGSGCLFDP